MEITMQKMTQHEFMIMKCIWNEKEPQSVRMLQQQIREQHQIEYRATTVYTYLNKLKAKGYVISEKRGASYFTPKISIAEYLVTLAGEMQSVFSQKELELLVQKLNIH